jgi:MraZ protein
MWRGLDGQVMVYKKDVWEQAVEKLAQQETRQRVRQAKFLLFSGIEVDIDRQGRVLIPMSLRRHADLGPEVVIVGNDDHLEVWNQPAWEEFTRQLFAQSGDIADTLADLGVKL